ncbi:MAG: esterase [Rhodocyclaceae bacterium]|nr:MAG: esterase [Rhodocyclaceae bacterium]
MGGLEQSLIVYLHGFRSSPASHKARQLHARMQETGLGEHFVCPMLPVSPRGAIALCEDLIAASDLPVTLVGSSLGAYYATWLAERHKLRAVLVNPAVVAHISLLEYVGPQTNLHSGESFEFTHRHIDQLRALEVPELSAPQLFWLLVETGDELLDYRLAVTRYAGARQTVLEGGDHSFTHWSDYLDDIIHFAGL